MSDLLNNVYLPDFDKRVIRDSDIYKLLKDNKKDTSILEGYENTENIEKVEFPVFNNQSDKEKFIEENATSVASTAKDYLETFGNFLTDETEDLVTSLQLAAVNGADVAVNLMPLAYKMFETAPIAMAMPKDFFNTETEEDVMRIAKHYSENLGEYREHLFEKQKDNGWVKDLLSFVVQDSAYSIPAYNVLRKAGVPKYPAFFLSAAIGAVGVENVDKDGDKTYFAPFQKDVQELKRLIGILPDTPADKIADEVHQALEYGMFGTAIPGIIDAFVFMKKYLPKFSTVTGSTAAVVGLTADNDAEGMAFKSIVKAVDSAPIFKSAVVDAAEKLPATGKGDQIYNTIVNTSGVKQSELKWMDLEGFLKGKNKVSKSEVLEYINNNRIDVSEVKFSAEAPVGLPKALRNNIDEYEAKWRDSDLADGVTPNYDRFTFNYKTYGIADNDLGKVVKSDKLTNDWYSISRSPFVQLFDESSKMTGTGTPWKTIKNLLIPFEDAPGKYTATVIEIPKKHRKLGNDLMFVSKGYDDANTERFVVATPTLEKLPTDKFKKIVTYEIDALELERFHLEDNIRGYKLSNAEKSNQPIYERYTSPGGENYTELVFTTKTKDMTTPAILEGEFGTLAGNKVKTAQKTSIDFMSPHFNRPNEFAHVRFKTRTLDNGKKALVVEEMQSDLLQASKTEMFASSKATNVNQSKVLKDFPFKNTWYEFTIKRLTRYAADNNFDAIAIPKGELAANRYGQKINKVKSVEVEPMNINKSSKEFSEAERGYTAKLKDENGEVVFSRTIYGTPGEDNFFSNFRNIEKDVGSKNLAIIQQLLLKADDTDTVAKEIFEKVEITGSGKGKFDLYNKTITSYMKKYAKKWNAKVYDNQISMDMDDLRKMPVTILELSPEMKKDVVSSSQPLFEIFGTVSLSTWAASEVSDSMKNNNISQTTN